MVSVKKTQFTALNDKRFYFFDGIVSLPFGHYLLEEARQEKKDLQKTIHQIIKGKKYDLLKAEAHAVRQYERLRILRSILAQTPMLYRLNSDKHRKITQTFPQEAIFLSIFYYLVGVCCDSRLCNKILYTTDNFVGMF